MNENALRFECVLKEKNDANDIMQWRNDPVSRKISFTYIEPKTLDQFYPEFLKGYFGIAELPSLFVLYNNQRVACLRFDPGCHPYNVSKRCAEISINIAPEWRHQGLGPLILKKTLLWVEQQGYDAVFARIKKTNQPSIKIFNKAEFCFIRSTQHCGEEVLEFLFDFDKERFEKVLVIAEAGSNWKAGPFEKDLDRAFALVEAAKEAGANIVKFQVFKAATTYVPQAGVSDYLAFSGIKKGIFELFKELEMPEKMLPFIVKRCEAVGIELMASVFSIDDLNLVNPYVKMHKMGSYEISHLRLLEAIAKTTKPLILSTGASYPNEIDWAVDTFYQAGGKELSLMQCTASYPASSACMNLRVIPWLKKRYDVPVGLSDHSLGLEASIGAVALGAKIIEKHFTLDKNFSGPDHAFALDPKELKNMVTNIRQIEEMLGSSVKKVYEEEEELYQFARRGLQALVDIQPGESLIEGDNLAILRPGKQKKGLHPMYLEKVKGRVATRFIAAGDGIQWSDFKEGENG
ncbi:Uncharacterized protein PHSC3_001387 [Chlamydiales bacterium STE3]|nr:Uncharacterized protein PHSC3_001387 [Chlamydiales bacterium STE3]